MANLHEPELKLDWMIKIKVRIVIAGKIDYA